MRASPESCLVSGKGDAFPRGQPSTREPHGPGRWGGGGQCQGQAGRPLGFWNVLEAVCGGHKPTFRVPSPTRPPLPKKVRKERGQKREPRRPPRSQVSDGAVGLFMAGARVAKDLSTWMGSTTVRKGRSQPCPPWLWGVHPPQGRVPLQRALGVLWWLLRPRMKWSARTGPPVPTDTLLGSAHLPLSLPMSPHPRVPRVALLDAGPSAPATLSPPRPQRLASATAGFFSGAPRS